jgi:aspartyl-tRNA(Asn)/glutamyl-tRNA(Gln) amidotransferase subunit C
MLTRQDVEKVSLLARLRLSAEELALMTEQLGQIVTYVESLAQLDTESVEPMAHAVEIFNVFAADELRPSLPRDTALAAAPHHDREFYLVPAVLGE